MTSTWARLGLCGWALWIGFCGSLGCSPRSSGPPSRITVGRAADVIALDPARISDIESSEACEQMFEHLVRYRKGSTEVEPALAVRWEVAEEGRSWTFHLRPNVRFHDGTPVNADAVVFSLDRQRDPQHPFHEANFKYWENGYRNIQRVEKIDDLTVRLWIDRPYAPFLANLAMAPASIVSPTAVRRYGHDFVQHPVGSGPFRFVEWIPGDRLTLEANPYYWDGGTPAVRHLVYRVIPGERERLVALESGAVDVAYQLAPKDLAYVRLHPDLQVLRTSATNVAFIAMNMLHPPFDDVRVRRAVNMAINKPLIVKLLYPSMSVPAKGPLPPTLWGYDASLPDIPYDPAAARALLAEAHYDARHRPRFYVMSTPRPYAPAPEKIAQVIARNLHDVGIDVELHLSSLEQHIDATSHGEHDLCLRGWTSDNGDPDNFLYTLLDRDSSYGERPNNVAFYRNAELHGLLVWARESADRSEREHLYHRALHLIAADVPWAPLAHSEMSVAARAVISGLEIHPSSIVYYRRVVHGR